MKTKQIDATTFCTVYMQAISKGVSLADIAVSLGMKNEGAVLGKVKRINEVLENAGRVTMPVPVSTKKRGRKPLSAQVFELATLIESLSS
jgi:hypothetical protein